jgi:hypothetical protein
LLSEPRDLLRRAFKDLVLGKCGAKQLDDLGRTAATKANSHAD